MSKTKLTINNNGSVKIDGDFEIVDAQGNEYGLQGRTVLSICRCGLSANKPFCDGTHLKTGFDGTETASKKPYMAEAVSTEGPALTLTDVWPLCDHSRFCQRAGGIRQLIANSDDPESIRGTI